MFVTTHLAVGVAVGLATKNPFLGFGAAVVSHHLIDRIPHIDTGSRFAGTEEPDDLSRLLWWEKLIIVADVLASAILLLWLLYHFSTPKMDIYYKDMWSDQDRIIAWSAFGAVLPDVLYQSANVLRKRFPFFYYGKPQYWYFWFHHWFHQTVSWKWWHVGLTTQFLLIGGSLWWLLR